MKLSGAARRILSAPALIERRETWFGRLQNLFGGVEDTFNRSRVFAVNGVLGQSPDAQRIYREPERWVAECLEDLAAQAEKSGTDVMFVPPCIESAIYGVHFIDSLFGSEVWFQDGQWYNRTLSAPVGELEEPDLEKSPVWDIARRAAEEFARQEVPLPLFGLPTIASPLNIAVNLYGEEILAAMLLEPDSARHDLEVINRLLCKIHAWYRGALPPRQLQPVISWNRTQPPGYGQLCGCTTQLISAQSYEELVAPLDNALLGVYPKGGMIHLCGRHDHLIPAFRAMPSLKALQLNDRAAQDLKLYFDGLREDQILYLNPFEGMSVPMALEITGGRRLVVADTIPGPLERP